MEEVISLREAFARLPDTKQPYRYPLDGVMTLICLAMMCGCNGEREIARWAQRQRWSLATRLGFPREKMPSLGTIQEALRRIEPQVFTRVVSAWAETVFQIFNRVWLFCFGKNAGDKRQSVPENS